MWVELIMWAVGIVFGILFIRSARKVPPEKAVAGKIMRICGVVIIVLGVLMIILTLIVEGV